MAAAFRHKVTDVLGKLEAVFIVFGWPFLGEGLPEQRIEIFAGGVLKAQKPGQVIYARSPVAHLPQAVILFLLRDCDSRQGASLPVPHGDSACSKTSRLRRRR